MYAGVEAEVWWRKGASTLTWGRMYANARVKVRCSGGTCLVKCRRGYAGVGANVGKYEGKGALRWGRGGD